PARGPDRGRGRPRSARGSDPCRRRLRDHEPGRDDGPGRRPDPLLRAPRPETDHRCRPDRVPPPPREAGRAYDGGAAADGLRRIHRGRIPRDADGQAPRRARQGRRRRSRGGACPRPLRVPDRRRVPLPSLRLWRAARAGPRADRQRRSRRPPLHGPGGPRDRPAQQAEGLRAARERARHRRGEPRAWLSGRCARLGDRQPDPGRPWTDDDPDPDEQSQEDQRPRGLRPHRRRAGADRGTAERREPPLPRSKARQARAQAAPPGSPLRRAGARRVNEESWPGEDRISAAEADDAGPERFEQDDEAEVEELMDSDGEPAPPQERVEVEEERRDGGTPASEDEPPAGEGELPRLRAPGHAPGQLSIPDGYSTLKGSSDGARRSVAVVVSRFNGEVTGRLLESALDELEFAGVSRDSVTVMPVPGAFELPLGAMALAKTRRFPCVVALGCGIRGETPHFDYVAGEAASGLQLAALETGVPVSFGVLTLDSLDQADERITKGAEAVRTALEMADLFAQLRSSATGQLPATLPRRVQGLRSLWKEARFREQSEPLDGGHQAPVQPEPAACSRAPGREGHPCLCLRSLPQGQQGPKGRLATSTNWLHV